jgi:peptide/nickel transport system ATP-binding protein
LNGTVLEVENLRTHFRPAMARVNAVDGLSFSVKRARRCGHRGRIRLRQERHLLSILRLLPEPPGKIGGRSASMARTC